MSILMLTTKSEAGRCIPSVQSSARTSALEASGGDEAPAPNLSGA